jgi:UDP-MurNAc hydroxylase
LVIKENDIVAINFNDNTPDDKACIELNKKFGKIDLALMNYNAAGPYPSCFDNFSETEKKAEHDRILRRNFDHLCNTIPLLKPKSVLPFAGAYVIGGKNYKKNNYLGTTTWDMCADYLEKNLKFKTNIFCLNENQIFDIASLKREGNYHKISMAHMNDYIEKIKNEKYDYELDEDPCVKKLEEDIRIASIRLKERTDRFKIMLKSNVYLNFNGKKIKILSGIEKNYNLFCSLDNRLLRRILDKKSHWNNAEIGTHISFKREPNKMDPDVHTMMSFFHI